VKFLESDSFTWSHYDDIKPFDKETFEDFVISSNHKNFKQWKEAFEKCCKGAGLDDTVIAQALALPQKTKTKNKSTSPSRESTSPKQTSRRASVGEKKKSKKREREEGTEEESPRKKKKNRIFFS